MYALRGDHNNVVQLLLQHPQIDVNKVDQDGRSALHWAVDYDDNHEGLAALLAQHDLTTINNRCRCCQRTPITQAVGCHAVNCLQALLAQNDVLTTINQKNHQGRTPIMEAVHLNSVKCFHLLLTNPLVDLDTRDNHRMTPQMARM